MNLILHEIRLLLSGLAFGFAFMPAIIWYVNFKYDLHLIVYNKISFDEFYREIYTRLDAPQIWFSLLLPYLLLRLILLLYSSKAPHPLTTTPLHQAAEQGNSDVVKILIEQGAMVDAVETASDYTPLHYAAGKGHTNLCELLIRFGADPDALTVNMESPLHLAIKKGRAGVVGVLLKYHARLDIKNKSGLTPLQQAEHLEYWEIVNLINQHISETWPYLQISHR